MVSVDVADLQNYGSFLQAYGHKKILEELGCSVEFVDYHVVNCLVKADGNELRERYQKLQRGFKCL